MFNLNPPTSFKMAYHEAIEVRNISANQSRHGTVLIEGLEMRKQTIIQVFLLQ